MKRRRLLIACLAVAALPLHAEETPAVPEFKGKLALGIFFLAPEVSNALRALAEGASGETLEHLASALTRVRKLPAGVIPKSASSQEDVQRENVVRGMLALAPAVPADTTLALAGAAAREVPMDREAGCYKVNAQPMAPCDRSYPLAQAQWAETYLKQHRDSPLTPYLYGYLMTRYRLAYEFATSADDVEARTSAARKYRVFLLRARTLTEPLARWVIEDIDRMSHIEIATEIHPRDYDPDACCNGRKGN